MWENSLGVGRSFPCYIFLTKCRATIIDHFQKDTSDSTTTAVLYFFCDHRDPGKQSFHNLLIVLVKQLLDDNDDCFTEIKSWRKEKLADSPSAKPPSTSGYIDLIQRLCSKWHSVRLIVDAFDECAGLGTFVSGFSSLVKTSNISLLLTSRHDVDLARVVDPIAKYRVPVVENMREDIHEYLAAQISERMSNGALKLRDKSLETHIAAELEKKADGM
jgi:hypothetical protein